ncbi:hypothetical protein LTR37_000956 [Vermiconidia calcicola]|uniref:Uncharacterized protein n=1 Tax=Vermiconidia calcicola TaxID=1690605 RepID=A0ACC3NYT3_9PEZI|nr:hypothetical protein LTR37_000956 [Vermiconidia calcicola]
MASTAPSTAAAARPFQLLKLPAELRDYIYELVFTVPDPCELSSYSKANSKGPSLNQQLRGAHANFDKTACRCSTGSRAFVLNLNYEIYIPKHAVITTKWLRAFGLENRSLVKGLVVDPGRFKELPMTERAAGLLGQGQEQRVLVEAASAKMRERLQKRSPWMEKEHIEEYLSITSSDARTHPKA